MIKLSIVIVNYNVVFYLQQCLLSVEKALKGIDGQIFVVDNNSVDGSCHMIRKHFPSVHVIENDSNIGFSKANNQAIKLSNSEYILLLNPDTIVEESCFEKIMQYMDSHPAVGGLGVRMIDGNGKFLPESKRGFPSPKVAFFKLSGLSKLFPKSKHFNTYHLGYLDEHTIHEIDVLSGACMLLRKSVLDSIGLLDETYFMYGEDIDLSYRIIEAGYKNIYFPDTTIVHYKGKSTDKGSMNYVLMFYKAMKIFAQKFFSKTHAQTFLLFINIAIYITGGISLLRRIVAKLLYPVLDFIILYVGFAIFSTYWGHYKYHDPQYCFPTFYYEFNLPIYAFILVFTIFITGSYKRPVEIKKTLKAIAIAQLINVTLFALLPDELRFSRAMFLVGTVWVLIIIPLIRLLLNYIDIQDFEIKSKHNHRTIIIGDKDECSRVSGIISQSSKKSEIIGFVSTQVSNEPMFIGSIYQLNNIIRVHAIEDVIFCEKDLAEIQILQTIVHVSAKNIEFKIAPQHTKLIAENKLTNSLTAFYTLDINSLSIKNNKTIKRLFDVLFSIVTVLFIPILCLYLRKRTKLLLKNCIEVLTASKTWIGYNDFSNDKTFLLPKLKPGILPIVVDEAKDTEHTKRMNLLYASNYHVLKDMYLVLKNFNRVTS